MDIVAVFTVFNSESDFSITDGINLFLYSLDGWNRDGLLIIRYARNGKCRNCYYYAYR